MPGRGWGPFTLSLFAVSRPAGSILSNQLLALTRADIIKIIEEENIFVGEEEFTTEVIFRPGHET